MVEIISIQFSLNKLVMKHINLRTFELLKSYLNRELIERLPSIKELMMSDLNAKGKVNIINNPGFRDMKSRVNIP